MAALVAPLLAAGLAPPGGRASAAAQAATSTQAPKPAARAARPAEPPGGRTLPDSVLAAIGPERRVTARDFRRGWLQVTPPARPDSLTPQAAREFLDLLIDKELLAERAGEESWEWTAVESAQVASLQDRTMMRTALDSALLDMARGRAARGEPPLGPEELGVAARESTVARLGVTYDEVLLARLAEAWRALPRPSPDSSIWVRLRTMGRMPAVEPADSARAAAWSAVGPCRVGDLLDAWKKLNPLVRPRVETTDQVRDMVRNVLFERVLRRDAERGGLDRHPVVVEAMARQRDYLASQYFVTREVYERIPTDEATLRRYYDRDPGAWTVPTRLQIVRLLLPERAEASRMAVRLRDPAEAETLVARGARQRVNYVAEITGESDSALFVAALASGTGTVLGPDSVAGGWQVARVNAVLPAHGRAFEDVQDLVLNAWTGEEGERRLRALLASLRQRARVRVNEPALERLVREGMPEPPRRRPPRQP